MRAGLTMPRMHGVSGWSVAYFRLQNLLYIHGMRRQSGNLTAHSGDLRRPRLYMPSSGGNGIDILNIYDDHNLPSVVPWDLVLVTNRDWCLVTRDSLSVTRDLACFAIRDPQIRSTNQLQEVTSQITESRLAGSPLVTATRHSRLKRLKSRVTSGE